MNVYTIIAIGNESIQDGRHLVPMGTLAPEWFCAAKTTVQYDKKDVPDPSMQ